MSNLSWGSSVCWEERGAAGNNTSPSPHVVAISAALCWTRTVRRLTVNSILNFMPSTKRASNLQINTEQKLCESHILTNVENTDQTNIFYLNNCILVWGVVLTLSWSRVWHCRAARCGRSHGISLFFLRRDTPTANPLAAQRGGSQTHQGPGR